MKRTKVLITIDWFLPGTLSGGPVRSYANLISHLNMGFEFYIITRNTDYGSDEPYEDIVPNCWVPFNDYTKIYYISTSELNKNHLREIFKKTDYDVAYVNGIYSWYFSILPVVLLKKMKKPIIVSARGMLNPQAFSVKGFKKKTFLNFAKIVGIYNNVIFHATNLDEAYCIEGIIGNQVEVKIAPNLPRLIEIDKLNLVQKNDPIRFVNVARIAVEKGTLKMLKALEQINQPLQLDLFGPIYDFEYWNKCEVIIDRMPKNIQVNYRGVLNSEAVPNTLKNYDFFVLLSEGENFGHAILEALSAGLPVLISNNTPWQNLETNNLGWDVDTDNNEAIVLAFEKALQISDSDYLGWSKSAFSFAKKFIENPDIIEKNKALFLNIKNQ